MANLAFQELLRQVASNRVHSEQSAALFARAAAFYSKGSELAVSDVEKLHLLALEAIDQVHGENYYDYENVHRGLEKLYLSQTHLPGETRPDSNGNLRGAVEAVQMDGIVVEQIREDEDRITIIGFADDNKRVAGYLRLLKDQVSRPDLNLVASGRRQQKTVSEFSISIKKR